MVTLGSFVAFWGWIFVLTTVAVWLGKRELPRPDVSAAPNTFALANRSEEELDEDAVQEEDMGVWETYRAMWAVLRKPAVQSLAVILLTSKVGFAAADALTGLKLQERGLKKEGLAVIGVLITPVALLVPAVVAKYTHGDRPLGVFMLAFPYRLAVGLLLAGLVWAVPAHVSKGDATPALYVALVVCFVAHQVP
jgi:PAT family acetyl-CoA transporter-like MFS transporter 1